MQVEPYDGLFHPVDGQLAKFGILTYIGYAINFMGTTPSWLIMIGISFFTRQFMGNRAMKNRPDLYGGAAAKPAGAGGAAAPPVAAKPPTPGKGGKKRR